MMSKVLGGIILILLLGVFRFSFAQVVINEIAWMGSIINGTADANTEWIELKNIGSSNINLSGWILGAGDGTPNISLSDKCTDPTILTGAFLLLERTNDDSVPGISADCIYTGALGNGGEFLKLSNDSGSIVDSIDASNGWLAGDNITKETMQRTSSDEWITAAPTPGAANSTSGGGGGNDGGDATSTTAQTTTPTVYKIAVDIVSKTAAVAGVPIDFSAKATGLSGEPLTRGKFSWNLGDGFAKTESETQKFSYTYFYPGDYLVILEYCSSSYYCPAPDATDRQLIKVLPASVTISAAGLLDGASVELTNSSGTEADLGRWMLDGAAHDFILAPNTLILAGKKIILPARVTGFTADDLSKIYLRLPGGEVVSEYPPAIPPPVVPVTASTDAADASLSGEFSRSSGRVASEVPPSAEQTKLAQPDARKFPDSSALSLDQRSDLKETSQGPTLGSENLPAAAAEALPEGGGKPLWPWLLGTAGVAGLAAAAVLLGKGSLFPSTAVAPKPSDDFKLIDE